MRRVTLLVGLTVLGAVVFVVDRVAAATTSGSLARLLRDAERLDALPSVHLPAPFLTQVARGRFRSVDVTLSGLRRDGLRVHRVDLRLEGVRVPPSLVVAAVRGQGLQTLVADHAEARLLLTYADLSALLRRRGLQVEAGPDGHLRVRVLNPVPVLESVLVVGADSTLRAEGTHLVVRAERFLVGSGIANALVSAAIGGRFDFRVEVGPLPVPIRGCEVTEQGLVLEGSDDDVVLDVG